MKYNQELRVKVYFFNDTATTEIYTLSLHDALPIFDIDSDNRLDTKVEELYLGFRNYFDSSTSARYGVLRSEEQTSELQSRQYLVCRLLLEKTKKCKRVTAQHILYIRPCRLRYSPFY